MLLGLFLVPDGKGAENSTKELIISILCYEWPLTVKQIHNRIVRMHGFQCSYQAIFKQVKELSQKKVLDGSGKHYKINEKWIGSVHGFTEDLMEHYSKNPQGIIGARNGVFTERPLQESTAARAHA